MLPLLCILDCNNLCPGHHNTCLFQGLFRILHLYSILPLFIEERKLLIFFVLVISILKAVLVLLSRTIVLDHTKIQRILVFKYNISFSLWIQSFSANLSNKKDGAPRLPMQPLCFTKEKGCAGNRIRTCVGTKPIAFETIPFDHSGIPANKGHQRPPYKPCAAQDI